MAGIALAFALTRGLVLLAPADVPRPGEIGVDGESLLFTLAAVTTASLVLGPASVFGALQRSRAGSLKGSRATSGIAGRCSQSALVVTQVAFTTVLLVGAVLVTVSLQRLSNVDPGIRPENVLTMEIGLDSERYETAGAVSAF